ncbi:hypothetical protein IFM89_011476 [Coptis chinensis]|uniref:GDSL esterase/lipase n=1 Tax=Coptis chinensis TaxID=261450 RepID=A0A835IWC2_9MAGN|nr:hypothetical protein IFM89_011476 [Coptis chinensis]
MALKRKMAKYYTMSLLLVSTFLHFLLVHCQSPLAKALYVFGDSLSDSGNNNFLQTVAKVNYTPYGIDFPSGPTGRFTNGRTQVDFLAQLLDLPFAPPFLGLSTSDKINIKTGINYASGAGGILPESGTAQGENLSFGKQIKYFEDTVLLKKFSTDFQNDLSKSIFYISIGSNDYINNYLQPANYNSSQIYTPQQYADLLVKGLILGLTKLYVLGARKFTVFNVGRLGCLPAVVDTANPRPTTPCVEAVNNLVLLYNNKLPGAITELERVLVGSTFVRGDGYGLNKTSAEAGITAQQTPCCAVNGVGLCVPNSTPCPDRTLVIFYDAFHPNQAVNNAQANDCFSGSSSCTPINVQQLAQKQ